jgi:lipopolysaccharide assembly outer membrane protein LptD (OstA)
MATNLTDTAKHKNQPLLSPTDTIPTDTLKKKNKSEITSPIKYQADTIDFYVNEKRVGLRGTGQVNYGKTELKAAKMDFDMMKNTIWAIGTKDSTGKNTGSPEFAEDKDKYKAREMTYNFKTKKGYIHDIMTEQDDAYLHGETIKKLDNGSINIKHGKYTTCSAEHPHFYLALTKAIVKPNDKIISGPAYLVLADVPLYPIMIPFGFFPNKKGNISGVLMPTIGEDRTMGFYLRQGGYYFAISDYLDFTLRGDIYTKGTWGANLSTRYKKRYKYDGSFTLRYYENVTSEKGLPDYSKSKDFAVKWSHRQDAKANPYSSFSASVDFSTRSYDRNHSYNISQVLNNKKSSSINFTKSWANSPFNISGSLNHNQNSSDSSISFTLPSLSISMSEPYYPFRKKKSTGKTSWYENIQLSYSSSLENNMESKDSLFFNHLEFTKKESGYQHSIPLKMKIKVFKLFNLEPSLNYKGVLYPNHIVRHWDTTLVYSETDTAQKGVVTDTINGLSYAHSFSTSIGFSLQPKVYGMYTFKRGKIVAIRHMMTPSASFSFTPDLKMFAGQYYRTYHNESTGKDVRYSMYEGYMYGTPTTGGKSASVNLSLKNNVEMKVKTNTDTAQSVEKVPILKNFDFSTSYNVYADSMNWSTIRFSGSTSLFKDVITVQASGSFDPYGYQKIVKSSGTTTYTRVNKWAGSINNQWARFTQGSLSLDVKLGGGEKKKTGKSPKEANGQPGGGPNGQNQSPIHPGLTEEINEYDYFNIPWSLTLGYSFSYSRPYEAKPTLTQTLDMNGSFSLTSKWAFTVRSGYDFESKKITTTAFTMARDLHCWAMNMSFCPFGSYKYYEFGIHVKASMLQDLKYEKNQRWSNSYGY